MLPQFLIDTDLPAATDIVSRKVKRKCFCIWKIYEYFFS